MIKDISDQRFGRLVALSISRFEHGQGAIWLCHCDCSKLKEVWGASLRNGTTKSCGCLREDLGAEKLRAHRTTHGHTVNRSASAEYTSWCSMLARCGRPTRPDFKNYGGRGIRVCERWLNSFENFFADMGLKPTKSHSLDRINNDGNYEPGNCRWATAREQRHNQRRDCRPVMESSP